MEGKKINLCTHIEHLIHIKTSITIIHKLIPVDFMYILFNKQVIHKKDNKNSKNVMSSVI